MSMTKRQRIEAALTGGVCDRLPYSFWTHFPGADLDPEVISTETAQLVKDLDLDFIKSMPNGLYCVEDWGVKGDYSDIKSGGAARAESYPVQDVQDWKKIRPLTVRNGAYGRELDHFSRLVNKIGKDVPVLATVFSPLTIIKKLAGESYRAHLASHPQLVKEALGAVAATVAEFSREAIKLGCAGVFFATQESTTQALTVEEYSEFGKAFDLEALAGASAGWFNVLHMHGEDIMFDLLGDYPVHAMNWHIGETPPSLRDYRDRGFTKPVVGGLKRYALTRGEYDVAIADIDDAVASMGGRNLILTPACVIRHPVDRQLLRRVSDYIKTIPTA